MAEKKKELEPPPTSPSELLPSSDGFGEHGVHDAFAPQVPAGGGGLSLLHPLLRPWERLGGAGQRRDQLHLGHGRQLRSCPGSEGGREEEEKEDGLLVESNKTITFFFFFLNQDGGVLYSFH